MDKIFKPLDLSEFTINGFFKKALSTENTKDELVAMFQEKRNGFEEDSDPVYFDKEYLEANRETINYLFGQLKAIHAPQDPEFPTVHPNEMFEKYNGTLWTKDGTVVMKLILLALALGACTSFVGSHVRTSFIPKIIPTLSPKDPMFSDWYTKYTELLKDDKNYHVEYDPFKPCAFFDILPASRAE